MNLYGNLIITLSIFEILYNIFKVKHTKYTQTGIYRNKIYRLTLYNKYCYGADQPYKGKNINLKTI